MSRKIYFSMLEKDISWSCQLGGAPLLKSIYALFVPNSKLIGGETQTSFPSLCSFAKIRSYNFTTEGLKRLFILSQHWFAGSPILWHSFQILNRAIGKARENIYDPTMPPLSLYWRLIHFLLWSYDRQCQGIVDHLKKPYDPTTDGWTHNLVASLPFNFLL